MKVPFYLLAALALPLGAHAQRKPAPAKTAAATTDARTAIREADIKKDLYALAADHYRGREAGTLDELRASVWLAEQARAIGAQPAGDDGTYFQFFEIQRLRLTASSQLSIGSHRLALNHDAILFAPLTASVNAPMVWVGTGTAAELAKTDVKGKVVALQFSGEVPAGLSFRRFLVATLRDRTTELAKAGAMAVVFVGDARAQAVYEHWGHTYERGRYDLPGGPNVKVTATIPTIWLPTNALGWAQQPGQQFVADLRTETFKYPSVNVLAKIPGTDAQLKSQYVLFGTHQDHDGVREAVAGDSIYNGADDNATGCSAVLAIMRAFKQKPGRRSALFAFQGAEERGLLGSRYYSAHPIVGEKNIVAVLNAEMMGRNAPDSASLLGRQRPHRNSLDLVTTALAANQRGPQFKLDTLWDRPDHPEGWFFRSDNLPYARLGIPALSYTTVLHPDYHTPRDERERIDYPKLTKMTLWMYLTGWAVANRQEAPARDKNFKLER
jgi:Zn-dependent M28 family amino/carboxypeptidase